MKIWLLKLAAIAALAAVTAGPALADQRVVRPSEPPRVVHLDQRYRHDHYYPGPGFVTPVLPAGSIGVYGRDGQWFFHGGVWFRPVGPRYIAVPRRPARCRFPPTFIVYPKLGQSTAQAESDRAACNQWAAAQSGAAGDASIFQRGFEACMDARGYSVR